MSASKDRLAMVDGHLGGSQPVVTCSRRGQAGIIALNRPKALNSLNQEMIDLLRPALKSCDTDASCKFVILKGEGRAFCAGGDVVDLATAAKDAQKRHNSINLFKGEYEVDRYIAHLRKPLVSLWHGIVMGGGAGLSVHGSFRVATEKTVFAMPETGIGLFPDVGANFFLPRLDGELGTYIALTSERLTGYAVYQARLATHFVPSSKIQDLEEALLSLNTDGKDSSAVSAAIDRCIESYSANHTATHTSLIGARRKAIDQCFSHNRLEDIVNALQRLAQSADDKAIVDWAKATLVTLESKSPTSLKVTLEGIRRGKKMGINEVLQMDIEIGGMFCNADIVPDFAEGVTHLLVRKQKDRAKWIPATIEHTSDEQIKDIFFSPKRQYHKLESPEPHMKDYINYPHSNFGLPSEAKIVQSAKQVAWNREKTLQALERDWPNKLGLAEFVEEVLSRCNSP